MVLMGLAAAAGFSAAVMLLWNWLMPAIFGLAAIGFWQALGLLVLARLLFGGIHGKHHGHHHGKGNPIREKWMKMSPEERREFVRKRHEFFGKECCGDRPSPEDDPRKEE